MFKRLAEDIDAVMERDPAAKSRLEVVLCSPGFHAVVIYRLAHGAWRGGWFLLGRWLSHLGRFLTGIEIHPGARVGRGFFIDHGMGVVIGETAEIGDNVTLYHDVTLGGVAPSIDAAAQANQKRHPTLADGVIVGSGAQILGPITVGKDARVGANAAVVKDVPPGATVVGIPARLVRRSRPEAVDESSHARHRFDAYGMPADGLPDPVSRMIDGLLDEVKSLGARVAELEAEAKSGTGPAEPKAGDRRADGTSGG